MRYIEVRRHTMRVKPGEHLSQAGVTLARQIGNRMTSHFNRVITSKSPRAYETAIAMGFAFDEFSDLLSVLAEGVEAEVAWDAGFATFGQATRQGGTTAQYGQSLLADWANIAQSLPEEGQALLITHGGIIEAGAVMCLPRADHAAWGTYLDYCEGVRLGFEQDRFTTIEILRNPFKSS